MSGRSLFFLLIGFSASLAALQWPVEEPELLYGFGSPSGEGVTTDMGLTGKDNTVRPFQEGEIIFLTRGGSGTSMTGKGVVVLEHENGFRSCYGRIDPVMDLENRSYLHEGDSLGTAPGGVAFSVRDSKMNRWVNPFLMFSVRDDSIKPEVEEVLLEQNGRTFPLSAESSLPAGNYRLLLRVSDRMHAGGVALLPYTIKIRYLGQTLFALSLDSLSHQNGHAYYEGAAKIAAAGLFTKEGYLDGGEIIINQGKGLIEVELTDYRGNRTLRSYSLNRR